MKYHDFWNEVYAKAPDADYYIDVSGRGTGKSTSVSRGIASMCSPDEQFILISRLMSDARRKDRYFEPETGLQLDGRYFINEDGAQIGYNTSLSMAKTEKSSRFDKTKWAIFEEFIPVSLWEYIGSEEPRLFSNLISTVFRNRPGKCILLGNMDTELSKYNQYFTQLFGIDWDVILPKQGNIYKLGGYLDGGKTAKIILFYGGMPFETDAEIGSLNRLPGNEVATTGKIREDPAIVNHPMSERERKAAISFSTYFLPGALYFLVLDPYTLLIDFSPMGRGKVQIKSPLQLYQFVNKDLIRKMLSLNLLYTTPKCKYMFNDFLQKSKE